MKHLIVSITIGACLLLSSAGVVFAVDAHKALEGPRARMVLQARGAPRASTAVLQVAVAPAPRWAPSKLVLRVRPTTPATTPRSLLHSILVQPQITLEPQAHRAIHTPTPSTTTLASNISSCRSAAPPDTG
jgi:hypothetical protein